MQLITIPGGCNEKSVYYGNTNRYRYDFIGGKNTIRLKWKGNTYTTMFWKYDATIMKRWTVDPKPNPSISVYNSFAWNAIW